MSVKKRKLAITSAVLAGAVFLTGCAADRSPIAGVIGGPNELAVAHDAPDFPIVTADGKETSFEKVRKKVAIVAFVSPEGDLCCWLNPGLVSLAGQLRDRPITVAQISEPTDKCPHGAGCIATCNLEDPHVVSLCDADRIAWRAYQEPEPNTVLLVDYKGKVAQIARLADLETVATKARQLADDVEGRW